VKAKLTITVDEELVPEAKRYARSHGASLSRLIENALREVSSPEKPGTFSERWRGRFKPAGRASERYKRLARKYL
jgi:Family of unknown function (DUF6364)